MSDGAGYVADTHALIWHYRNDPRLSATAREAFSQADRGEQWIYVSAITLVEIVYLEERGWLAPALVERVFRLMDIPNGSYSPVGLGPGVARALRHVPRQAVPDMPDRIIVATAFYLGWPLISNDKRIVASGVVPILW